MTFKEFVALDEATKNTWKAVGFVYDDAFGNAKEFVCISDGTNYYFRPSNSKFLRYADKDLLIKIAKKSKMLSNEAFAKAARDQFGHLNIRTEDRKININNIVDGYLKSFANSDTDKKTTYVYVYAKIARQQFPIIVYCSANGKINNIIMGLPGETPHSISNLSYALDRSNEKIRNEFDSKYGTGYDAISNFIRDAAEKSKGSNEKFIKNLEKFMPTRYDRTYKLTNMLMYKDIKK